MINITFHRAAKLFMRIIKYAKFKRACVIYKIGVVYFSVIDVEWN